MYVCIMLPNQLKLSKSACIIFLYDNCLKKYEGEALYFYVSFCYTNVIIYKRKMCIALEYTIFVKILIYNLE